MFCELDMTSLYFVNFHKTQSPVPHGLWLSLTAFDFCLPHGGQNSTLGGQVSTLLIV